MSTTAVLIPVKSFATGKSRLGSALDPHERHDLAKHLATSVVEACAAMSVFVVCEDQGVALWAKDLGADVIRPPYSGLSRVVRYGVAHLGELGFDRSMVAHADLADATNLPGLVARDGIVLVPDTAMDGTNVLIVPTSMGFSFSYGPNSFARHLSEAERSGLEVHVVVDQPGLSLDLDDPQDLEAYSPNMLRRK
jgi:2-phospho-L-lactate guanylyltransferase